jgi:hypothetical protein
MSELEVAPDQAIQIELFRIEAFRKFLFDRHSEALHANDADMRLLILLASLLKVRKQAQACALLAKDFMMEEISAITRTMAEVVVNAAYLQFADDEEIDRFHNFDTQSLYKLSERLRPITTRELTPEKEAELQRIVSETRMLTQLTDKAPSWSRQNPTLIARAEFVESKIADSFMPGLVLTAYNWGHRAVHGTGDSLRPFYGALGSGEIELSSERLEEISRSLGMVAFCLQVHAFFYNRFLRLNFEEEIIAINNQTP